MDIRRVEGSFDQYKITTTSTELETLRAALASTPGAEADAILGAIDWYLDQLPAPGETKDDADRRKEMEEGPAEAPLGGEPGAGDDGVDAEVDDLLAGEGGDGGEDLPGGAGPGEGGGEEELVGVETEVDDLVPPAPEEAD